MGQHESIRKDTNESVEGINKKHTDSERIDEYDDSSDLSVDNPGFLSDVRSSHSANAAQRAQIMSDLQQSHGNAYVQRLLSSRAVQAKLTVSAPDDEYEQEADRVGDQVARAAIEGVQRQPMEEEEEMLQAKPLQRQEEEEEELMPKAIQRQEEEELLQGKFIQRQEEEEELMMKPADIQRQEEEEEELQMKAIQRQPLEEEEEMLQPKTLQRQVEEEEEEEELLQPKSTESEVPDVSADLETRIDTARTGGESLPDSVRAAIEPQMEHDFSDVRIHTDTEANDLSHQLEARAFTTGNDIFFQEGDYQPDTEDGMKLLGHEMTHVVQQGGAPQTVSAKFLQRQDIEVEEEQAATKDTGQTETATEGTVEQSPATETAEQTGSSASAAGGARGFNTEVAAQIRDAMMRPIEQAAEEALSASPPDIQGAVSLIAQAIVAISEAPLEQAIDPGAAAQMRHQVMTPLEQAGETLSATIEAPERAMSLLSSAIIAISSLQLETAAE